MWDLYQFPLAFGNSHMAPDGYGPGTAQGGYGRRGDLECGLWSISMVCPKDMDLA